MGRSSSQRLQLRPSLTPPSPHPALPVLGHSIHSLHRLPESFGSVVVASKLPQYLPKPVKSLRIIRTPIHILRQRRMSLGGVVELQLSHADLSPHFARRELIVQGSGAPE